MPNVDELVDLSTSTPEDAAKNIDNSNVFNMQPDEYKNYSEDLDVEAQKLTVESEVQPVVKDYMAQSTEHSSLSIPDLDSMSYIERQIKLIHDHVFDRPTIERDIIELNLRKMDNPEAFGSEDEMTLGRLNDERQSLAERNYGLDGPIEQLPAQVAGQVVEFGKGLARNADIIAAFTGAGAVAGAFAGSIFPGVGTLVGATAVGTQGLIAGVTAASFKDGYDAMVGSTYNELSNITDDDGNPIEIDNETKANISRGVGVVSGVMTALVGRTIAKTTPFLSKLISPRLAKQIVLSPTTEAIKVTLNGIGKAVAAGGLAGGSIEVSRILAEEMGRTYDGTEASFLNALASASTKIDQYAERVATAAVVSGLAAGTIATTTGAIGFKATKSRFKSAHDEAVRGARDVTPETPLALTEQGGVPEGRLVNTDLIQSGQTPIGQSVKVLQFQDAMMNVSKVSKATNMNNIAPAQLTSFKQMVFAATGLKNIWVNVEDLRKFATDETRGAAARNIIDESGVAASQFNAPVKIPSHQFMELIREFPDASDVMKLSPEGPNSDQARAYLESLKGAADQRREILAKLGAGEITRAESVAQQKALAPVELETDVFNEPEYLLQPTFTEAIESVISGKEVEKFNNAQLDARQRVVDSIDEAARFEMDQVRSVVAEAATESQVEIETQRIVDDPFVEYVDRFTIPEKAQFIPSDRRPVQDPDSMAADLTAPHHKKGFSPFAIDPRTLPPKLKKFEKNAQLKKHKVFVKGGITADESARLIGSNSGENLLKLLSTTPSRQEIIDGQVTLRTKEVNDLAKANVDLNQTSLAKAYNDNTANHIKEMRFMREKSWPATKTGIKRIALPLPKINDLRVRATAGIAQTLVGELNVNQFKVGERKSQRMAINNILKNEVEQAFMNKEAAALNSEFAKQTHIAIGRVNKVIKFAKRFNKPAVIQELKDAGKSYTKAVNEILDVFNLNPSRKGLSEVESYEKYVRARIAEGEANFEIPDRMSGITQSVNDMTTEAVILIGDRLKAVLHQARFKNKLHRKFKEKELIQTEEAIAQAGHELAVQHPDYDPNRIPSTQVERDVPRQVTGIISTMQSLLNNMEHIVLTLDKEELGGFWHELIVKPIKGDGEFNKVYGESNVTEDVSALKKFFEKNIEAYGKKDYLKLENTVVVVPEFDGIKALNGGRLSKGDLLVMMAYGGDPDGFTRRLNFGVSNEVINKVLERELEVRDAVFVQNFMLNGINSYKERTQKLQRDTTGQDVDFIEPKSFTHRGKVYPGGYFPLAYKVDLDLETINSTLKSINQKTAAVFGGADAEIFTRQYAAEMTKQGRLEERTGSDKPLDLSMLRITRSYEEIIHDLNFRIPVRDGLKLLRNPTIKADITSMIGPEKYGVIVNTYIETANRVAAENANYFSDQNRFIKATFGNLQSGFAVSVLGANLTSTGVQFVSLAQAVQKMGIVNGSKHMLNALRKISGNMHSLKEFYDFAAEINPSIKNVMEGVDANITSTIHDLLPSRNIHPALAPVERARKMMVTATMSPLVYADQIIKVLTANAAYEQFISGDVKNFPTVKLVKMSENERHQKAIDYARQISRTTLTHTTKGDKAPIQKLPLASLFVNFWNDLRNVFNGILSQGRQTKWKAKASYEDMRNGNFKGAASNAAGSTSALMTMVIVSTLSKVYIDLLRGKDIPSPDDFDFTTQEGQQEAAGEFAKYMLTSTPEIFAETIPGVRDIKFAADRESARDVRNVQIPIVKQLSDFSTSYAALKDLLEFDSDKELTKQQLKALLFSSAYLTGGWPVNASFKAKRFAEDNEVVQDFIGKGTALLLSDQINEYVEQKAGSNVPEDFLKQLKDIETELRPSDPDSVNKLIPEDTTAIIKMIESGGNQWAKNPNSTAAGLYQFLESTWADIMARAPDLGLTVNGRVSGDTAQQEKAMNWFTENNASQLIENKVPIVDETLYGAHFFGAEQYIEIHNSNRNVKLKTILPAKVLKANPQLSGLKTVGAVKDFLVKKVAQGRKLLEESEGN